ncbi:MAG: GTP-binding protein [Verrucomicrobiales bacterium]|nr:GTP-binding protein [Verrucomicrobiales bacterium]
MKALPVYLVAGFLGSGKSTLLERVISDGNFPRQKTALIINDAGPMNVDAKLFRGKAARIAALTGGCACCVTPQELISQLKQYAADANLEQVWIEASGVADLEDLLDCLTNTELVGRIEIRQIIYVVDAENFPRWFINRWVHEDQAKWADVIIINKTDKVSARQLDDIKKRVRSWNANGEILQSEFGKVKLPDANGGKRDWSTLAGSGGHVSMKAFFVPLRRPVARKELEKVLQSMPEGVCRVKGFVRFTSAPDELQVVHQVGKSELSVWRYEGEVAETGLVVIGLDLDVQLVQHAIRKLTER